MTRKAAACPPKKPAKRKAPTVKAQPKGPTLADEAVDPTDRPVGAQLARLLSVCPRCGDERQVERLQGGVRFCACCAHTW